MQKVIKLNLQAELNWKQTRDRRLLNELLPHYYTVMEGFIRKNYTGIDTDDIYEIMSIAIERFFKHEEAICTRFSKVKVTTWLISVVRTITIDYLTARRKKYELFTPIGDMTDIEQSYGNNNQYLDLNETTKLENVQDLESFYVIFLNELEKLPQDEKLFFKLKHIQKLSYNEMLAKYPEYTQSDIRNKIYKAKQTLIKKLKKSYIDILDIID